MEEIEEEIAFDCDGVLLKLPGIFKKFPYFLRAILSFFIGYPDEEFLKAIKKRENILVVTARPNFLKKKLKTVLESFLEDSSVQIIFTGGNKNKIKVLIKIGIKTYIEDNKNLRKILNKCGILALSPNKFISS